MFPLSNLVLEKDPNQGWCRFPLAPGCREKPIPSFGQCFTGAYWGAQGKKTSSALCSKQ